MASHSDNTWPVLTSERRTLLKNQGAALYTMLKLIPILIRRWSRCLAFVPSCMSAPIRIRCRNGVIDREELRALLESTDSGSEYAMTVRALSMLVA